MIISPPTDHRPQKELEFSDPQSGITIRSSRDGRRITARNALGLTLWSRDPFLDANIQPYREPRPTITAIAAMPTSQRDVCRRLSGGQQGGCIVLSYTSTQFFLLDLTDGDLVFLGQD